MKLVVCQAASEDIYKDIARIPENHRKTEDGKQIKEGRFCKITVGSKSIFVILRGKGNSKEKVVFLDSIKREELGVNNGDEIDVKLQPLGPLGGIRWALRASDLAYRETAWLAVLSVCLGLLGFALGIISIIRSCR